MPENPYEPPKKFNESARQGVLLLTGLGASFILFIWLLTWMGIYDPARDDDLTSAQIRIVHSVQAILLAACIVTALIQWRALARPRS